MSAKAFLKLQAELKKRVRQIEDLIREKNRLIDARKAAQAEAGRLRLILQDIAYSSGDQAREIARRAIGESPAPTAAPKRRRKLEAVS